jgi:hypothetical protein
MELPGLDLQLSETFDGGYIREAMTGFARSSLDPELTQKLSIRLGDGQEYGNASLKAAVRLVSMLQSDPNSEECTDLRDKVARQLLQKVDVSFWQDGKQVGTLSKLTGPDQNLESDAFLQDNWIFYQLLLDVTTGYVLKNFTAPPKATPPAVGAGAGDVPRP